jgi:hypothetical protein
MKNAMVMPTVLMVTLFISILIGTYMMSTSVNISRAYHRDLAEVRGYWGAYGAKELNATNVLSYRYGNYNIDVNHTNTNTWEWNLTITGGSGVTNNDIYTRVLTTTDDTGSIESYEGN